jgi:hypothetical protein
MTPSADAPLVKCARLACPTGFTPARRWHRFCTPNCRAIDWQDRNGQWPREYYGDKRFGDFGETRRALSATTAL